MLLKEKFALNVEKKKTFLNLEKELMAVIMENVENVKTKKIANMLKIILI